MRVRAATACRLALALAVSIAAVPAPAADPDGGADGWVAFHSEAGGFSVEMPSQPTPTETHRSSFLGDVTNHIFTARQGDDAYTVDYSEVPGMALEFAGAGTIYEHARGALLAQTWSRATSFEPATIQGHPGRRLVYDCPPRKGKPEMTGRALLVLIGRRLYVADAVVPEGEGGARAERFLRSLRFD